MKKSLILAVIAIMVITASLAFKTADNRTSKKQVIQKSEAKEKSSGYALHDEDEWK